MKSKSPFAMKSPLLAYKSDQRGNYANPEYVPRVDVGAAVGAHVAKTAADVFSSISQADKAKQKAATDKASGGSNVNKQTVNVHYGSGSGSGGKKEHKFGFDFGETNLTPDPIKFPGGKGSSSGEGYSEDRYRDLKTTGESTRGSSGTFANKDERKYYDGKIAKHMESGMNENQAIQTYRENHNIGKEIPGETTTINQTARDLFDSDGKLIKKGEWKNKDINKATAMNMKGSPNKLIGDTMDPYGQINPGAVPPNQAQNDLGAQPIIGAQGSQPSARAIDMAAIENPYATPGADFDPQSKMKAESIFGSAGQRQGLMNLGTPLAHKTAAKHPEPHRKTKTFGGKLKPGDPYIVANNVDEGGSNPPDTLNLKKHKQPNYMSNPGDQYKKDQFPDEDIFSQNNDQLNKEGFNTDSTSSVRIFKG